MRHGLSATDCKKLNLFQGLFLHRKVTLPLQRAYGYPPLIPGESECPRKDSERLQLLLKVSRNWARVYSPSRSQDPGEHDIMLYCVIWIFPHTILGGKKPLTDWDQLILDNTCISLSTKDLQIYFFLVSCSENPCQSSSPYASWQVIFTK